MDYTIRKTAEPPALSDPESAAWRRADAAEVDRFRPESSDHRPQTIARILYDDEALYICFHVEDRYVRSVITALNGPVCEDSCVEFFVAPVRHDQGAPHGYLNFEVNAGGSLHASHVRDPRRGPDGQFLDWTPLTEADAAHLKIATSLPNRIEPERTEPVTWAAAWTIPFALLEQYVGPVRPVAGATWRGNLYKCGDETSHPHWAAWSPVSELNFHAPKDFGRLHFQA
jgi:hypothetical protein